MRDSKKCWINAECFDYSKVLLVRPPLGLSKSGLLRPLLDSPKGGLYMYKKDTCVENEARNNSDQAN